MKRILSFFATFAIFVAPTLAQAVMYTDVPASSWYAPYVQELVDAGIVDAGTQFRPADSLNRAEMVKLVIEAIDGLANYAAPAYPAFDDVQTSEWYYNYVEAAATLGIVSGYKDDQGSLIGTFGPGDQVSRAQATKILVEAFDLEATDASDPGFPDVSASDWFYGYVSVAEALGVVSGYDDGRFRPNDPVSRAEISKMISISLQGGVQEPEVPQQPEEETPTEEPPAEEPPAEEEPQGEPAVANPENVESNVLTGSGEQFVASYRFQTVNEGFRIETLTIVNDVTGNKLGDEPEGTPAIKNVILKFPDQNGILQTESRVLDGNGKARFANLDFFAVRDDVSFLDVYVELTPFSEVGPSLSGEVFRVGIQDINNTDESFRAVGNISGFVYGFGSGGNFSVQNAQVESYTVRKSVPVFANATGLEELISGENKLMNFTVSNPGSSSISLARIAFEIDVNDANGAGLSFSDFRFFRNSSLQDDEANLYDATGAQDITSTGGGTLTNGKSFVIVSFNQADSITPGDTVTYSLRASAAGIETSDSVTTRIADGDELNPLSGLTAVFNDNTGQVYVSGGATAGIFSGAATDFSQSLGSARNVIWSDQSAQPSQYPSVSAGSVSSGSGSADWINGYLLHINALDPHTLSK